MPNWSWNELTVLEGDPDRVLGAIRTVTKSGETMHIDFERIVKCPMALDGVAGPNTDLGYAAVLADKGLVGIIPPKDFYDEAMLRLRGGLSVVEYEMKIRNIETYGELIAMAKSSGAYNSGLDAYENLQAHGALTWYDWSIRNWGTKWNACDSRMIDRHTITFNTAWDPSVQATQALSRLFPAEVFVHRWAGGRAAFQDGYSLKTDFIEEEILGTISEGAGYLVLVLQVPDYEHEFTPTWGLFNNRVNVMKFLSDFGADKLPDQENYWEVEQSERSMGSVIRLFSSIADAASWTLKENYGLPPYFGELKSDPDRWYSENRLVARHAEGLDRPDGSYEQGVYEVSL